MNRQSIKNLIYKLCFLVNRIPFNNRIRLRGACFRADNAIMVRCRINCRGKGNTIILHPKAVLRGCLFQIRGDNNIIEIGENTNIIDGEFLIEDDINKIFIGKNTSICGKTHLACIEGCKISIGDNCLFSSDIVFRTGDSHSILDSEGNRINRSKDITINNHVWVGNRVLVNKGVSIAENSIIGTGAIVTKEFTQPNVIIAGIPAHIVKLDVGWCAERI